MNFSSNTIEHSAIAHAKDLLVFHVGEDTIADGKLKWSVDEPAKEVGSVPSIDGTKMYKVFEVWGHVYKGRYRMRLAYDVADKGDFVLMGEEILEDA